MSVRNILLASLLLLAFLPPLARATSGILDQSFDVDGTGNTAASIRHQTSSEVKSAQGFTVGMDGTLVCVEVRVQLVQEAAPLILEIRPFNEVGLPGETVLASASVPASAVPTTSSWVAFDLSAAALSVSTGQQYVIVLRCDEVAIGGPQFYNWFGLGGGLNTYAGGDAFVQLDAGPWSTSFVDRGFRTYVSAPVSVESATWSGVKQQF